MIKRIDDIKEPPIVGELYLVPCMVIEENTIPDWEVQLDGELANKNNKKLHLYPVINHPHTDVENGQKESHYHRDFRFKPVFVDHYLNNSKISVRVSPSIDDSFKNKKPEYFAMACVSTEQKVITPTSFISKSKLKHKCIHKGKCPHRGYDLSQEVPVDGVITCPLHGLKFDKDTKVLLNDPMLEHIKKTIDDTIYQIDQYDDWSVGNRKDGAGERELRDTLREYESKLQTLYPESYSEMMKSREIARIKHEKDMHERTRMLLEPTNH